MVIDEGIQGWIFEMKLEEVLVGELCEVIVFYLNILCYIGVWEMFFDLRKMSCKNFYVL